MAPTLMKTNMTLEDVVYDPGKDSRYWCLPPMRDDPDSVVAVGGGFEFHLVTQGREVGVWKNWTVAKAMVAGYPNGTHKGHHSYESCTNEWQLHCQLGVHPHPADPSSEKAALSKAAGPSKSSCAAAERTSASAPLPRGRPRRSTSTPGATRRASGALAAATARAAAVKGRYFAIWGGGVVYSSKYKARLAFDEAVEDGDEPELLSTDDFDLALAYAAGEDI
ncbi:hypothetical protein DFH08DRAFT_969006 [Mycena albidolilacea]|uniref:Ribonuclease H1 N-terminal domain-containing protein n=1 Tax=Mycena albidolilacea TaxID=1033008 RepID=A0AAD6ZIX3_9AGAR|nr:hypothetical protein DFH08DRAFT_969006 [Mycena albidolilacea]